MAYQKFSFIKYATIGIIAGLISYVLAAVMLIFGLPEKLLYENQFISITAAVVDINLRDSIMSTGQFGALGEQVLSWVNMTGFNLLAFLGVLIGSVLTVVAGRLIVGKISNKYADKARIILSFLIGSAILGLVASIFLKLNIINTTASVAVYGLVLGIIMQIAVQSKKLKYLAE